MVKGNANFMSPEQARGPGRSTRAAISSRWRTVMYYCLTGRLLYDGRRTISTCSTRPRSGPTPEDLARIASCPSRRASILAKALAFDPAERFQSATEFADALAAHIGGGKARTGRLMRGLFGNDIHARTPKKSARMTATRA